MIWKLILFIFFFLPSLGNECSFECFYVAKYIYFLWRILVLIILEFYSTCNCLIVIIHFLIKLIFIGDFRGLHIFECWSNEDLHLAEWKLYIFNMSALSDDLYIGLFECFINHHALLYTISVIPLCLLWSSSVGWI